MKNLKYKGMVESKIFWRLRGLETGLSGFKLEEYIMVNFCYKLFGTNLISLKPNAALFFPSHKTTDSPSFIHYQFFSFSSSSPFGLPSPKTHSRLSGINFWSCPVFAGSSHRLDGFACKLFYLALHCFEWFLATFLQF